MERPLYADVGLPEGAADSREGVRRRGCVQGSRALPAGPSVVPLVQGSTDDPGGHTMSEAERAAPALVQESRGAILHAMLRASVVLGAVAYLPGAWASFQAGLPQVVLLSTTVYGSLVLATFLPGLPFRVRSAAFLGVNWVLAVGLLLMVGPPGAGAVWLTAVPVIAGALQGTRAALWSLGGLVLTAVGFALLIHLGLAGPLAVLSTEVTSSIRGRPPPAASSPCTGSSGAWVGRWRSRTPSGRAPG